MNMANNESFKKFFLELHEYFSEIKTQLFNGCRDITNEWKIEIDEIDELQKYFDTITDKIKDFQTKLFRENKKMIVFGETSSGKSTFINALLQRNLLKMGGGATTKCPIKIQLRPDNEEYIMVNGERKSIKDLQDLKTSDSPLQVSINGFVNVFINYINSDLQLKELEIVDTPGINTDINIDDIVKKECNDSDIIIIIISCSSIINMTIKNFCENIKDAFSNISVFIIFNRSEEIDSDDVVMGNYFNDARQLLTEKLRQPPELIENRIYFIRAKEQLNNELNVSTDSQLNFNFSTELLDGARLQRNENFENMKHHLQREFEISHFQRKCSNLDELILLVENSLGKVKEVITKYESLFSEIIKHIGDYQLLNISKHNEKIKLIISDFFEKHYEEFLKESIKQYKEENGNNETEIKTVFGENCINFKNEIGEKINEMYRNMGSSENDNQDNSNTFMTRCDSTAELITQEYHNEELIQNDNDENPVDLSYILEEFYFQLIDERFEEYKNNKCDENFKEINKKIKNGKIATIGSIAGLGVAGLATGGIALGVGVAIEIAVGVGGTIAVGSVVVAGTTTGVLQILKDPFRYFWREDEKPIKDNWENFKTDLIRLFDKFLEICKLITSVKKIRNELINVGTELERIKQEINLFKMECIFN